MFWLFTGKRRVNEVKEEARKGFDSVKKDILSISEWIKHLDTEKTVHRGELDQIKGELSSLKEDIDEIKQDIEMLKFTGLNNQNKQPFKTPKRLFNKQTAVQSVQTAVQTAVQTPNLSNFSITERAIIGILLNSDLNLSYEDLSTLLGKEKSTIRGQINAIKAKSESLILDHIEKNGKKRVYIPKEMKEKLLKKVKVRAKSQKDKKKNEEK